jgi:hypothetical protein
MKKDFGDLHTPAHRRIRDFRRGVKAQEKKLKWLSDAEFINWDKSLLSCPQPGSLAEDRDFAALNTAMWNERQRRCDEHNGLFGWRRLLTPADREIWLQYYAKAVEIDSKRPRKESAISPQVPRSGSATDRLPQFSRRYGKEHKS